MHSCYNKMEDQTLKAFQAALDDVLVAPDGIYYEMERLKMCPACAFTTIMHLLCLITSENSSLTDSQIIDLIQNFADRTRKDLNRVQN